MAYISYTGVPLYFGYMPFVGANKGANDNTLPVESNNNNDIFNLSVVAQQVQLNYTPNIAPVRVVGKNPTRDNFNLAGPPNASLSFSCYVASTALGQLTQEFNPLSFTGDVGDTGAAFRLGDEVHGISGSGAFLNSFSYTLTPYAPVLVQCDFAIYNPMTTISTGGKIVDANDDTTLDAADFGNYAHGAYSHIKGGTASYSQATHEALGTPDAYAQLTDIDQVLDDISIYEAIQYQYTAQRLPVYEAGSYTIKKCELITEEQTLGIQGDNIQKLVPITGSNPGKIILELKGEGDDVYIRSVIDGRLNAENVSIQGGDLARGSITITELLK